MDFFDINFELKEKRRQAAHLLVVPYDATPDMIDAAYIRRLQQRFCLKDMEFNDLLRGNDGLYDARIRMRESEKNQWRAALRLMMATKIDKAHFSMLYLFKHLRSELKSTLGRSVGDDLVSGVKKMCRLYNISRGILVYDLTAIWGTVAYRCFSPEPNLTIPIAINGSMIVASMGTPFLFQMMRKGAGKIIANFELYKAVAPVDAEMYQVDEQVRKDMDELQVRYDNLKNKIADNISKRMDKQK